MMVGIKTVFFSVILLIQSSHYSQDGNIPVDHKDSVPQNPTKQTTQPSTSNKGNKEDEYSSEAGKWGSRSWHDILDQLIEQTEHQVNDHIEALTNSAQQASNSLADQAMGLVETSKDMANNRMVIGRVYNVLRKVSAEEYVSTTQMVDAFATAIAAELHGWMPTHVNLPGLEMKVKLKYMCGSDGRISNLQTMALKRTRTRHYNVTAEEKSITTVLTYSFRYLHMTYDRFGASTLMTSPVVGKLDLGFNDNEVEFEIEIPNVSVLSAKITPECFIYIKNFKVTRLAVPQAKIEPASAFRTYAEQMVDKFATHYKDEFRNLFRLGVVKSLHDLLQSNSKWVCKSDALGVFAINEENVLKPNDPEKFEKYCGDVARYAQFLHNNEQQTEKQSTKVDNNEKIPEQGEKA